MILFADNTTSKFFEILTSWSSPLFVLVVIALIIVLLIYFLNRYLIKPTEQKHKLEKQEIELKNSQMMALFAALDPDPIIRVSPEGRINFFNDSASKILNVKMGDHFTDKLTEIELKNRIKNNSTLSFPFESKEVHYDVLMIGNSVLNIAQFYFRDISKIKSLEIKLKQLSQHLQNQIDEERFRIAHELHDGIVQDLFLIRMGLSKIEEEFGDSKSEHLSSLKTQLKNLSDELRRIIYDLKPKILDEMGLEPALNTLCNNVSTESGIQGSVQVIGIINRLEKKYELFFYRIIQEALSNVVKHSGASEFSVFLIKDAATIKAIITDNGGGIKNLNPGTNTNHFGLLNIKERTEGLSGSLKINSTKNEGLTLIAEIPYKLDKE